MSSKLTQNQNNLIKEIALREGISNYDLEVNCISVKGDGYLGIIFSVNLTGTGRNKKLNLILKRAEPSEQLRKKLDIKKVYLREIYVYNTILPKFDSFMKERGLQNGFNAHAKFYGSCEDDLNECLILENLKEVGYKMWDRRVPMDPEHVALVFSEYGKLHAVSLALRGQEPEVFKELVKDLDDIFKNSVSDEGFKSLLKATFNNGLKAVQDDQKATEALQRFSDTAFTVFKSLNQPEDCIAVVHGDSWCNNMMFKYEACMSYILSNAVMSSELTQKQNNLIKELALREGIYQYDLKVNCVSVKGDGYLGTIFSINLTARGNDKKLNLILKKAETSEELRKRICIVKIYLREIYVYRTIFPKFDSFMKKQGVEDGYNGHPKFYGSCDDDLNECLILENLKTVGYKMWNRRIPMNSEHVALVFTEYGRLHAASLALSEQEPEVFKELTKNLHSVFKNTFVDEEFKYAIKISFDGGLKAVQNDVKATEALERFSDIAFTYLKGLDQPEDAITIVHGDCWCNNMMFKYEDSSHPEKPTKVCLLDWQLTKLSSPAADLAYFFCVCSPKEVLYDYERYLKIYHESLSDSLRKMSCDPEKIFPYTLLESHWRRYAKFGLYMALMIIKLMLSEENEVPVLKDVADSGESVLDSFQFECARIDDYNKRVADVVNFMREYDFI